MKFPPAMMNTLLAAVIILGSVNVLAPIVAGFMKIEGVESDPMVSVLFGGVAGVLLGIRGRNGKDGDDE